MLSDSDIRKLATAKAKGKRPKYLGTPTEEHLLSMVMVLAEELAVMRERSDTLERLLEAQGVLAQSQIEDYVPNAQTGQVRQKKHLEFNARLLRSLRQEADTLQGSDKSAEEMAELLKKA
jgi:hypothetical protein